MFGASKTQRIFFFNGFLVSITGILLTGYSDVHWFSYVLPAGFLFAALTGFCLGMFMSGKIASLLGIRN